MLIKPWNAVPAPRYALDDEADYAPQDLVPDIKVKLEPGYKEFENVLVVSRSSHILAEMDKSSTKIGKIIINYTSQKAGIDPSLREHYDEDEQLYAAIEHNMQSKKYDTIIIPIELHFGTTAAVVIPNITSLIAMNCLACTLINELQDSIKDNWIVISNSEFEGQATIRRLQSNVSKLPKIYEAVPFLEPPSFICGAPASIVSSLSVQKGSSVCSIVLKGEGQVGFEKLDPDSLMDACFLLSEHLVPEEHRKGYKAHISSSIRQFNTYTSLNMYV